MKIYKICKSVAVKGLPHKVYYGLVEADSELNALRLAMKPGRISWSRATSSEDKSLLTYESLEVLGEI